MTISTFRMVESETGRVVAIDAAFEIACRSLGLNQTDRAVALGAARCLGMRGTQYVYAP